MNKNGIVSDRQSGFLSGVFSIMPETWALYALLFVTIVHLPLIFGVNNPSEQLGGPSMYLKGLVWISTFFIMLKSAPSNNQFHLHLTSFLMILLLSWFGLSALYAPDKFKTILTVISLTCSFFVVNSYIVRFGSASFFKVLWKILFVIVFISDVSYFISPTFGRYPRWDGSLTSRMGGLIGHPQGLGLAGALLFYITLFFRSEIGIGKLAFVVSLSASILATALAQSRTSMIIVLVALIMKGATRTVERFVAFCLILFSSIFFGLVVLSIDPTIYDQVLVLLSRSGDPKEVTSATGRNLIWSYSLYLIDKEPIIGYGYNSTWYIFSQAAPLFKDYTGAYVYPHTHNVVLQILFSGGIVALAIYTFIILNIVKFCLENKDINLLILLFMYLVFSFSETGGFFQYADFATIWISMIVSLTYRPAVT